MHGASETRVLVTKGRKASLLLVRERRIRLLVHEGFKDRVAAIRAKARLGSKPVRTNDMLPLSSTRTHQMELSTEVGILEL